MARHHLDHASTTPLRPAARAAMVDALDRDWGDPSRLHEEALAARHALETSRESIGQWFGARAREVLFTSGATEAIVTACWGAAARGSNQVLSPVEHSAVRGAAERHGEVRSARVDRTGRVDPESLVDLIDDETGCVHLQWGNHEVGTTQPITPVIEACRERGVLVHIDAAQAAGRVPIDFGALGADLVSVSGHKLGGPAGVGVLLVRRGVRLQPLMVGGDQERARRAGMENVVGVVGLAAALGAIDVEVEAAEQDRLRSVLADELAELEGVEIYGSDRDRLPHIVCAGLEDVEPQAVLLGLDRRGVAAHSGSACASEGLEPSPVLEAMGVDAHRSLRLSVGWSTTEDDVKAGAGAVPEVLSELRALRR